LAFGVDYKLNTTNTPSMVVRSGNGATTFFTLTGDYYAKDTYRAIPVALNYNVRAMQFVFAAGAGIDFQRVADADTIGLGYQVSATYEIASGLTSKNSLFVQAKYFLTSHNELNGIGVYVGMHF